MNAIVEGGVETGGAQWGEFSVLSFQFSEVLPRG
jgi:hypothetical protein